MLIRSVMKHVLTQKDVAFFSPDEADLEAPSLAISQQRWEDMGSPTVVTVVVEPGDKLNP